MNKKAIYPAAACIAVVLLHGSYIIWNAAKWASIGNDSLLSRYLSNQDYFMGLSYGLAAGFTAYSLMRFTAGQRGGLRGAIGGLTMTGILYFGGCFLLGCCGSPMLAVYLSLFGSSYAGFTKPLVLIITMLSIVLSWIWMQRKTRSNTIILKMK